MSEQTGKERMEAIRRDLDNVTEDLKVVRGFVGMVQTLEKLSGMAQCTYDAARGRYQSVSAGRPIPELELLLEEFFGPPKKRSDNPLPAKLSGHPIREYLEGGIEQQSLFFKKSKSGLFYGSLEPMAEPYGAVTVRLGFARKKGAGKKEADSRAADNGLEAHEIGLPAQSLEERMAEQLNEGAGEVNGVGLATFLLESEAEQASCSIRVVGPDRRGYLFVKGGVLIDATCGSILGKEAAAEILSWVDTRITLEDPVERDDNVVGQPLVRTMTAALQKRRARTAPGDEGPAAGAPAAGQAGGGVPESGGKQKKRGIRLPGIRPLHAAAVAVVLLLAAGGFFGYRYWQDRQRQEAYAAAAAKAEAEAEAGKAAAHLQAFIDAGPKDDYSRRAAEDISRIQAEAERRLFRQVVAEVEALDAKPGIEAEAERIYGRYLKRYPNGQYAKRVRDRIGSLGRAAEEKAYRQVQDSRPLDEAETLAAYRAYLERFPTGRHSDEVRRRIEGLAAGRVQALETAMRICEREGGWQRCLAGCDEFLAAFGASSYAPAVRQWRETAQEELDLAGLQAIADAMEENPEQQKPALERFIQERGDSPAAAKARTMLADLENRMAAERRWRQLQAAAEDGARPLSGRIEAVRKFAAETEFDAYRRSAAALAADLERQLAEETRKRREAEADRARRAREAQRQRRMAQERQRLAALEGKAKETLARAGGRFAARGDGTFVDTRTGLIWCMLDSSLVLKRCQSYQEAERYVSGLATGNFRDWRMPNAAELAGLYKNPPFFPAEGAPWYWTSKVFTTGYHTKVRVVSSIRETEFRTEYRRSTECGAVRAVRDP